ncbi:uncharacterized protein LOC115966387 [Quercus lobata]|uniref:uncharacterized protein LOC115966387 n=1 Tax=Quercus lobata TaxID=97700 RepID=UPI001246C7F2|nr:uncharacterized protein LOC115966387 [Quercus lobata]
MNIIVWNSRGALKPSFQSHIRELVRVYDPDVFVVMETRLGGERVKDITERLPFDGAILTDTIDHAGGLWLLWNSNKVEVTLLAKTEQEIHVTIKVRSSNLSWLFSAIYASPRFAERSIQWNNLINVAELHSMPWVIAGDFNEPLSSADKLGGRDVSIRKSLLLKDCLDRCNMIDLGFSGSRFTGTNCRDAPVLIQERIDRFFVNPDWCTLYPEAKVSHLTRCHSDHCPVLLETRPFKWSRPIGPFKFQSFWLSDPSFPRVVQQAWSQGHHLQDAITRFSRDATNWNKVHFGNIFAKKRRVMARLDGIQRSLAFRPSHSLVNLERQLQAELAGVLNQEEELWALKS